MKLSFKWTKNSSSNPLSISLEECLSRDEAEKVKRLNFEKALMMTSAGRIKLFATVIPDKAEWFNSLFEKEFVLKKQKIGLRNWISKTKMTDKARQDILRRVDELEEALAPEEQDKFLEKLANIALGIGLTKEEEEKIYELADKVNKALKKMEQGGSREDYEREREIYETYIEKLKKSV